MKTYLEIAWLFFRLGLTAFGGPAVHVGMMEDEFVERRGWLDRQHFLDLVGATNLIPGPNSTELTMHIGYERGRWLGLFVAGISFIFPAAVLTGILAWLYVRYGSLPHIEPFLIGIKPAVLGIIAFALYRLGKKAVKSWQLAVLGAGVVAAVAFGLHEVVALLGGGLIGMMVLTGLKVNFAVMMLPAARLAQQSDEPESLTQLFLFFLKIGTILYGSGYVLVAFIQTDLVARLGWLTETQLLDAIAMGQFTPGPILTTATFIGYLLGGFWGAVVATLGMFLPSFLFVGILNPLVPRLRQSRWASAFLDSVNVAAVGLMMWVVFQLGRTTLIDWRTWLIGVVAAVLAIQFKLNAVWLVLGGAIAGYLLH